MTTSLVTGGAGFLGSHLCDYLIARGQRVICVDNLETQQLLDWGPEIDVRDGIRRTIEHCVRILGQPAAR